MTLCLLCCIVLGILGQVALVACLRDGGGCRRPLYRYEMVQLVFQLLKSIFAIILYF